eukprot:TRINITY_DN5604_c0_g1_i2.p1 TRINITY_DN5604_c0_g1~~TRINITY_DN5604_c0_g1_i2.p1  ORF type:complete len:246 (+),score=53.68 TRINITY_DN5604_c0_g1_i2:79-816(+)
MEKSKEHRGRGRGRGSHGRGRGSGGSRMSRKQAAKMMDQKRIQSLPSNHERYEGETETSLGERSQTKVDLDGLIMLNQRISKPIPSSAASGLSSAIEEPYSYELDLMEMEKTLSRIPWIEFIGIQQYADEDEDEGSEELESAELPSPTVPIHESPSNTNFKTRQEVHLPSITELMKEGGTRKESHAKANVPHDSCDETLEKLLSTTVTVPLNTFDTAPAAKSAPGVSVSVFSDVKDDADNFLDDL